MINRKTFSIILLTLCLLISGIMVPCKNSQAMTPRVMMTEYSLDKKEIYPGDSFNLTFKLKNTSKNSIMNMKCQVVSDKGEFLPVDGVGTTYVAEIKGEEEQEFSFNLEVVKNLEEKTYNLKVKTEYETWNGSYKSEDTVYVPITLKTEVLISDTYIAEEEIRLGDNIEIVSTVNNIGAAEIYKVTAEVKGHNIANATTYVGNVKPGKSANIDIITKADKHDDERDRTDYDNDLIITYEDINGKKYTEETSLGDIEVLEQDFSDVIQIKEDNTKHISEVDKAIIVVVIIIVIVVVLLIRRVLKRKRLERSFE